MRAGPPACVPGQKRAPGLPVMDVEWQWDINLTSLSHRDLGLFATEAKPAYPDCYRHRFPLLLTFRNNLSSNMNHCLANKNKPGGSGTPSFSSRGMFLWCPLDSCWFSPPWPGIHPFKVGPLKLKKARNGLNGRGIWGRMDTWICMAESLCCPPETHNIVNWLCVCMCVCVCVIHSVVSDSVTPWTVACQAPLSMGFSRQEYWSGLPFLSPGDLPDPGIKPRSPALQADSLSSEPSGKPIKLAILQYKIKGFFFFKYQKKRQEMTIFSIVLLFFSEATNADWLGRGQGLQWDGEWETRWILSRNCDSLNNNLPKMSVFQLYLVIQWLRLCASTAWGKGQIPSQGSSTCCMMWPKN